MKKNILFAVCIVFAAMSAHAGFVGDFKKHANSVDEAGIKGYAKDVGLMLGMTDFHNGKSVSFPGADIGVVANFVLPNSDNKVEKAADKDYMVTGMLFAETKIPFLGFSVAARGTAIDSFETIGGGVKYTIIGGSLIPDISAAAFYDRVNTDHYSADHVSVSVAGSWKVLILEPYIVFGYDKTDMDVKLTGAYKGADFKTDGGRMTLGLNVTPFPFVYIYGAYTVANSKSQGVQAGIGVHF